MLFTLQAQATPNVDAVPTSDVASASPSTAAPSPSTAAPSPSAAAADDTVPQAPALVVILSNRSELVSDTSFLRSLEVAFAPRRILLPSPERTATATLGIVYNPEQAELSVSYTQPSKSTITRVVEAPVDPLEVPDTAAFLAVNLVQAEAEAEAEAEPEPPAPAPLAAEVVPPPAPAEAEPEPKPFALGNAGLYYPLATNYDDPKARVHFDFVLLYGRIGELDGLQLGTVNTVHGDARGMQLGALVNADEGTFRGVQIAGLLNTADATDAGVQLAGIGNYSRRQTRGLQATFGLNLSGGALRGVQVGLGNHNAGSVKGAQAAPVSNFAADLLGAQVSLLFNRARDINGAQIGLINIGRRVKGMQVGLVNLSDDLQGVPIGLANISKTGGIHLTTWASLNTLANVGLKLATRYTYSMGHIAYHKSSEGDAYGMGFTVGARVPISQKFEVDIDVGGEYLIGTRLCCHETRTSERLAHAKDRSHYRLRVIPAWQALDHLSVFAGAGIAARVPFAIYSNFEPGRGVSLVPELLAGLGF